jgi:hypothetical protein
LFVVLAEQSHLYVVMAEDSHLFFSRRGHPVTLCFNLLCCSSAVKREKVTADRSEKRPCCCVASGTALSMSLALLQHCLLHNAGKREKVTAEMKRAARKQREAEREEKAASQRKDKEEIFEVGFCLFVYLNCVNRYCAGGKHVSSGSLVVCWVCPAFQRSVVGSQVAWGGGGGEGGDDC